MAEFFKKEDLHQFNYSKEPNYDISINGKLDINHTTGTVDERIGLSVKGMQRLVRDWFKSNNNLSLDEKAELIELLSETSNRRYNTVTQEWEAKNE